jgi:hypothetical protein
VSLAKIGRGETMPSVPGLHLPRGGGRVRAVGRCNAERPLAQCDEAPAEDGSSTAKLSPSALPPSRRRALYVPQPAMNLIAVTGWSSAKFGA